MHDLRLLTRSCFASSGNAYIYAVQGHDAARRRKIDPSDTANRLAALASVLKTCPARPFAETWGTGVLWNAAAPKKAAPPAQAATGVSKHTKTAAAPLAAAPAYSARPTPAPADPASHFSAKTHAPAVGADSGDGSDPDGPATVAALATVLAMEQTIKHLGGANGTMCREATIVLSGGPLLDVTGMAAIDLEVLDGGDKVRLQVGEKGGWHCFKLGDPIDPGSVRAKFSKKRRTLTLTARCTG